MELLDGKPGLLFMCDRRKGNVRWVVRGYEQQIAIAVAVLLISLRPSSRKEGKHPLELSPVTQIWKENFPLSDPDSATLFPNYKLSQSRSSQRCNFKVSQEPNFYFFSTPPLFFWCPVSH
ncbi:hypothetical protein CEXT_24341 [Caerostris extrusa]|uniref:Uncharacterized protein n=1 Tax=Caerostris extrusa TaxID=172846 RepID=A0AAV4RN95_CAEEX|nr:hypothetical protein CEXT_24341 [Caerostris extrusa]